MFLAHSPTPRPPPRTSRKRQFYHSPARRRRRLIIGAGAGFDSRRARRFGQPIGRIKAVLGGRESEATIDSIGERAKKFDGVFFGAHRRDDGRAREKSHRRQIVGERRRRVRIVGDIDNKRRRPGDNLRPPRQKRLVQAFANRARVDAQIGLRFGQRFERGDGDGRVLRLAKAGHSGRRQIDSQAATAKPPRTARRNRVIGGDLEIEIRAEIANLRADLPRRIRKTRRRIFVAAHRRAPAPQNARFFAPDRIARAAQIFDMIERDIGDCRDFGVDQINRVQPPAQPDFQNHRVRARAGENPQRGQCREFEISQFFIERAPRRVDGFERGQQRVVFDFDAVDSNPLVKAKKMRRAVAADAQAARAQRRFEQRANRTLAVGAADDDGGNRRRQIQRARDPLRARKPQSNVARINAGDGRKPIVDRARRRGARAHALARGRNKSTSATMTERIFARGTIASTAPFSSKNSLR